MAGTVKEEQMKDVNELEFTVTPELEKVGTDPDQDDEAGQDGAKTRGEAEDDD